MEDFETQGIRGVRGFSAVSENEGDVDFEAVKDYHKISEEKRWHLVVGESYLPLAGF